MIQTSRSTLLFLVYIGGLSIVQVATTFECSAPNEIGCASCGKIAICDASLQANEIPCGTGKVCGNGTGNGGCYSLTSTDKSNFEMCVCDTYPDYMVDPYDPNKYLMCVSETAQYPLSCAAGLIFSEDDNKCIVAPTDPPTTTLSPPSCSEMGFFGQGCDAYYACIPDVNDPSKFTPTPTTDCNPGEVFDESAPGCVLEADVINSYEFECDTTVVGAQMDSVECNAFQICTGSTTPVGEKICCSADERFDSSSMTCVPASQVPDESCPQVNECIATKLSFNCSDGLVSSASSSSVSSVSASSSISSSLSSTSSSGSSSTSSSGSSSTSSSGSSSISSSISSTSSLSSSSLSSSPTTTMSSTTAGATPDCSKDGAVPYPGNCSKYYWCSGGKYQEQTCPSQMLFDKVKGYCNVAASVVC